MIGGLWEVSTKSEKVGPNDPQNPKKWVTKIVSGQSALITAIASGSFGAPPSPLSMVLDGSRLTTDVFRQLPLGGPANLEFLGSGCA
jgi:hypothetical protein